ncbi:MAG: phosphatidylglycerol lysyltransferase domain-containing protein [Candidatus Thiodiazotropha endolucinida]
MTKTNLLLKPQNETSLVPVTETMLPMLQSMLNTVDKQDPFQRSAAYYAMTGRNGLWLYSYANTAMLIAVHPNKDDTILMFPPFGSDPVDLMDKALIDPLIPAGDREIARLGEEGAYLAMRLQAAGASAPCQELVLDWTYPVHVISTRSVIERQGGKFNSFRGHVNRALRAGLTASHVDFNCHAADVLDTVKAWARDGKKAGYSFNDLTTPTMQVISLMQQGSLPIEGVVIFVDRRPVGFWFWDESDQKNATAMSLVRVSIGSHGAAEFGALKMCELLSHRGFEHICLGGSETESLDRFKRKLGPVQSIELRTACYPK